MGVRRVLILIVGFCLFVNLILLGLAKFAPGEAAGEPELWRVTGWIEGAERAEKLRREIEKEGLRVEVVEVTREKQVPDGWLVAMRMKSEYLAPVEQMLKERHHRVTLDPAVPELRLNGVYRSRREAQNKARAINKLYGIHFEVYQNYKPVPATFQELRVAPVEGEAADRVVEILEAGKAEVQANPVEAEGEGALEGGPEEAEARFEGTGEAGPEEESSGRSR